LSPTDVAPALALSCVVLSEFPKTPAVSTGRCGQTSPVISLTFTFDNSAPLGSPQALTLGATGLDFVPPNCSWAKEKPNGKFLSHLMEEASR
jgi:hypothetical protein